jgi:hypothetical protein
MVLALLEHLPVVVPRNLREKTLKLHKVSYPSAFPSGTGKPVVDNWCGFSESGGYEGLTDMDADDEFGFDEEEMTAEQLVEMDRIEREAFQGM